jgi:putative spermidine/putrescine transport system permease protein
VRLRRRSEDPPGTVAFGWRVVDGLVWVWRVLRLGRLGGATGYALVLPGLAFVAILGASLAYLGWLSIHKFDPFLYKQGGLSLENYSKLDDSYYFGVFERTLTVSAIVTVLALALGLPLAYMMVRARSRVTRFALLSIVFLPFLTGEVVRAYSWLAMLGKNGAFPWLTAKLGLGQVTLIGTSYGVALGMLQLMLPLTALILVPAVHGIEPELEEAANTLGARPWRTWLHVVLPLARPGLAAGAALSFTLSMTEYAMPALLGGGLHDFAANVIQSAYFRENDDHLGAAIGVVLLLIVSACVALILWSGQARRGRRPVVAETILPVEPAVGEQV